MLQPTLTRTSASVTLSRAMLSSRAPHLTNMPACGRIELRSRPAEECVGNFDLVKCGMTEQEVHQETSRCLRCDHFGYGIFKGGRSSKW